jgi:hypothetical protein
MVETALAVHADSQYLDTNASPTYAKPQDNSRVRDLEQKVDRLLKEMEELRKEMKVRPPSRGGNDLGDPVLQSSGEWLAIPFNLDPQREPAVVRLVLFASRDEGKSWQKVAEARPTEKQFRFRPSANGVYWFSVATVDASGNRSPSDPTNFSPALKVSVKGSR